MILAVIPARSGSKSVKDKNIRPLGGRPLMAWSIKAALACKKIDQVMVSTDSEKYAQLAKFYGAEIITRPAVLAADDTPMIPVLQHVLQKNPADLVVKDIDQCLEKINQPDTDSVVTVTEAEHNPYYVMCQIDNGYLHYPLFKPDQPIHRRQDAPKVYRLNAGVYVIKKTVLQSGKIFTERTRAVEMPQIRSSHIDSELDFKYADWLIKEKHVQLDF